MKKFFTLLAMVAATLMLTPNNAEARDRYHRDHHHSSSYTYYSGRTSCGCPTYTRRVVKYYDCHGHPVYAYYRQPVRHTCRHHNYRSHYRNSCDHGYSGYRRDYRSHRSHTRVSYSSPYGRVTVCR